MKNIKHLVTPLGLILILVFCLMVFSNFSLAQKKPIRIQNPSPEARWKGFELHKQMQAKSTSANLNWQFVCPINVSGHCTDVAVVTPKGKNYTICVATASGGVWKTE